MERPPPQAHRVYAVFQLPLTGDGPFRTADNTLWYQARPEENKVYEAEFNISLHFNPKNSKSYHSDRTIVCISIKWEQLVGSVNDKAGFDGHFVLL